MSGHVGDLSAKQQEALAKFRENIQDILPLLPAQDDYFILKWLRARCFDLQKSEAMIRKHVEFRKRLDSDHILEWKAPEVIEKYLAGGMCGFDREGSPVLYEMVGTMDAKGLLFSASKQDFIKKKFQDCEIMWRFCDQMTEKLGRKIETVSLICDMEGLGLKHLWKPAVDAYGEVRLAIKFCLVPSKRSPFPNRNFHSCSAFEKATGKTETLQYGCGCFSTEKAGAARAGQKESARQPEAMASGAA
ncbi:hypothetical protein lerEdw1_019398 [Lerista edwardsae]|nr:hypothetical protein lerEdw1_019398 [Lerista edwardsae]